MVVLSDNKPAYFGTLVRCEYNGLVELGIPAHLTYTLNIELTIGENGVDTDGCGLVL